MQSLDRLRHLIQRTAGTISLSGEKGLAAIAANLPTGYRHGLQERVTLAMRRVRAFAKLEKALQADSSEAAIVAAWQAVVKAQCEQFASIEWGMRIAVAEERLPVFKALSKLTSSMSADERDRKILAVWKEKLMADCREADKWRPLYQMAAVRREVLKRLQASIDARNDAAIVQWGSKRCLTNYPLPQATADAVAAAREHLGNTESLLTALNNALESENGADGARRRMRHTRLPAAAAPNPQASMNHLWKKGTVPICRNGPKGALHKWGLSPFPWAAAGVRPAVRFSHCPVASRTLCAISIASCTVGPQRRAAAGNARFVGAAGTPGAQSRGGAGGRPSRRLEVARSTGVRTVHSGRLSRGAEARRRSRAASRSLAGERFRGTMGGQRRRAADPPGEIVGRKQCGRLGRRGPRPAETLQSALGPRPDRAPIALEVAAAVYAAKRVTRTCLTVASESGGEADRHNRQAVISLLTVSTTGKRSFHY